jgi:hypothetical protein
VEFLKPSADGKIRTFARVPEEITTKVNVTKQVNGKPVIEQEERKRIVYRNKELTLEELKGLKITTAVGQEVNTATAVEKLANGATVVISSDGKPVDSVYLRAYKDDVLVLSSEYLVTNTRVTTPSIETTVDGIAMPLPAVRPAIRILPAAVPPPLPPKEEKKDEKKEEKK